MPKNKAYIVLIRYTDDGKSKSCYVRVKASNEADAKAKAIEQHPELENAIAHKAHRSI